MKKFENRLRRIEAAQPLLVAPCSMCGAPEQFLRRIFRGKRSGPLGASPGCKGPVDDDGRTIATPCIRVRSGIRPGTWTPGRVH